MLCDAFLHVIVVQVLYGIILFYIGVYWNPLSRGISQHHPLIVNGYLMKKVLIFLKITGKEREVVIFVFSCLIGHCLYNMRMCMVMMYSVHVLLFSALFVYAACHCACSEVHVLIPYVAKVLRG